MDSLNNGTQGPCLDALIHSGTEHRSVSALRGQNVGSTSGFTPQRRMNASDTNYRSQVKKTSTPGYKLMPPELLARTQRWSGPLNTEVKRQTPLLRSANHKSLERFQSRDIFASYILIHVPKKSPERMISNDKLNTTCISNSVHRKELAQETHNKYRSHYHQYRDWPLENKKVHCPNKKASGECVGTKNYLFSKSISMYLTHSPTRLPAGKAVSLKVTSERTENGKGKALTSQWRNLQIPPYPSAEG